MKSWNEIRDWRRVTRAILRSRRVSIHREYKDYVRAVVSRHIRQHVPEVGSACIGFCWPFKGEIDFRSFIRGVVSEGGEAALPVVVGKGQPLEFWSWRPHMKMRRGVWNIPVPAERRQVRPTVLLVPLVGFDEAGYRLGYGGGYFDRTLAATTPKPLTIGVGYELGRLSTIHPQPHDIPMDAIVTEKGFVWIGGSRPLRHSQDGGAESEAEEPRTYASSPCYLHELVPSDPRELSRAELLDLLGQLLEGERAGARSVGIMSNEAATSSISASLRDVARDEARFCAMLTHHIRRLGGTPSSATGAFFDKIIRLKEPELRLDLLNRGQAWVVRKLREALPMIGDAALRAHLREMLDVHERNIETCALLKETLGPPQRSIGEQIVGETPEVRHADEPA